MIAIFAAVERGDAKIVEQLFSQLPERSRTKTDYRSRTALHLAIEHGHCDLVEMLIDRDYIGFSLSHKDCGGFTPLHLAVELGHDQIVARLLAKNPESAREKAYYGLTCLQLAVIRGHSRIVRRLLAMNLTGLVSSVDKDETSALDFAIEHGREEIVAMLVKSITRSADAKRMFRNAINRGYDHVVAQILVKHPNLVDIVDSNGKTVLHLAAENGHHAIVAQLLAQRPNLAEVEDAYGKSLLQFAARYGYDDVLAQLIVVKPHLIAADMSVLHLAAEGGHKKICELVLAAKPVLASQRDFHGRTALHLAATNGHEEVVAQLLAHSPELIDVEDQRGETALQSAVSSRCEAKAMACLITHGAAGICDTLFWGVLHTASDAFGDAVVQLMLDRKPELARSRNRHNNNTALHCVLGLRKGISKGLFSEELMLAVWQMNPGALRERDRDNETPFHAAIRSNNEFAKELVQWKLSLEEIMDAFTECNRKCPRPLLDHLSGALLEALRNKDIANLVFGYVQSERINKKRPRHDDPAFELLELLNQMQR